MDRRARIVATLGPATDRPGVLEALLAGGLDVARVNFSHGSADEHTARVKRLREAAAGRRRPVAVLADLPGPKLRVRLAEKLALVAGAEVAFHTGDGPAPLGLIAATEPECLREVQPGQRLLLDDGRLQLTAVRNEAGRLVARVDAGGELLPNKGLNLPDTPLTIPALTPRDREALTVAAAAGVDWLGLSFVRDAAAADELRGAARGLGIDVPVMAKMERPEAVRRAAEIVAAFDGIMVARGDLGVEMPLERVPAVQKRLIALARAAGKPVVTATDMLDSMRENPRPTRAEASDVANAVYDGTDAVMLSGETAVGAYPVEAFDCMRRIIVETEADPAEVGFSVAATDAIDDVVTAAACELARRVRADAIVTPTWTGRTARLLARHRPAACVVAPVWDARVYRQLAVVWGLVPVLVDGAWAAGEERLTAAVRAAFAQGAVAAGQLVVVLAGRPAEGGARTPTVRVVRVADGGRPVEP